MINKDDLVSLTWEQKKKYRAAIEYGYFDDFEDNPRQWKHTLVGSLLWKYPTRCMTINRLKDIVGHVPQWEDITEDVLRDFVDELTEDVSMSSARTICAELKGVLSANKRKIPAEEYARILSVKGEVSQFPYLTRDEIMRIIEYRPLNRQEEFVKQTFLIQFMTGARRCDAECMTINQCDMETNTLSYIPKKTPGIVVTVPVDEKLGLRDMLRNRDKCDCCPHVFNDVIHRICRQCGIDTLCTLRMKGRMVTAPKWQLVSSHTARRSFATNLYISGISLEDIAILMGHGKNIETTKRYICAERPLSTNVIAYFQPQSDTSQAQECATC